MKKINKEEIKDCIDVEKYLNTVLRYKKQIDDTTKKDTYQVMIFEVVYMNILMIILTEYIQYRYDIKIDENELLKKIDKECIFSRIHISYRI